MMGRKPAAVFFKSDVRCDWWSRSTHGTKTTRLGLTHFPNPNPNYTYLSELKIENGNFESCVSAQLSTPATETQLEFRRTEVRVIARVSAQSSLIRWLLQCQLEFVNSRNDAEFSSVRILDTNHIFCGLLVQRWKTGNFWLHHCSWTIATIISSNWNLVLHKTKEP
jgi:hypothetical protein